jgi:nucleotide-binding universal stress UspA family protein
MSFPFRRILSPIDFEDNSLHALNAATQICRQNSGTVFLLHVVPMVLPPTAMPAYVNIYKEQEGTAKEKLRDIAEKQLRGIKYENLTYMGEPAGAIVKIAKRTAADLIVMSTHARRGFSHVLLGSVAELVLRYAPCPVLCVHREQPDKNLVSTWMSSSAVSVMSDEKLSSIEKRMKESDLRCLPVVDEGRLVGIITDRDLRSHSGLLDETEVKLAMSEAPSTIVPTTPLHEAARLITANDIVRAFLERD